MGTDAPVTAYHMTVTDRKPLVGTSAHQTSGDISSAARWRYSFRMCYIWCCVSLLHKLSVDRANTISSWLVFKIVDIIRYRAIQHPAVIASGIITNVFIIISVLSAFPWVRK